MKRYPNGADGDFFFMKRAPTPRPDVDRDLRDRARLGQRHRLPDDPGPRARCSGSSTSAASTSTSGTRAATTSTGPTTCTSTSIRCRGATFEQVARRRCSCATRWTALACRATRRRPARAASTSTCRSCAGRRRRRCGRSPRRSRPTSRARHPTLRHRRVPRSPSGPPGACSSTTTRTRGAARSRRSTRCGRARARRCRRRSRGQEVERGARDRRLPHRQRARARRASVGDLWAPLLAQRGRFDCERDERVSARMTLPIAPPIAPMEARLVDGAPARRRTGSTSPSGTASAASPSATATRSSSSRRPASRSTRYFPEVVDGARARCTAHALRARRRDRRARRRRGSRSTSCCSASIRREPRASKLARERPALLIVFDLLVDDAGPAAGRPAARASAAGALEALRAKHFARDAAGLALSPATTRRRAAPRVAHPARAARWTASSPSASIFAYRPASAPGCRRSSALRTADCVVGGFRYASEAAASWARCCSASTTTRACSTTSASPRASRPRSSTALLDEAASRSSQPPGFTGNAPGRAEPLEHRAQRRVGAAAAAARRRGAVRPLHRRPLPPRHHASCAGGPDKAPRQCTLDQVRAGGRAGFPALLGQRVTPRAGARSRGGSAARRGG